jgi:hypothetical protein
MPQKHKKNLHNSKTSSSFALEYNNIRYDIPEKNR